MHTIAPSMPSHACPSSAAEGPRRGVVPQAPTVQICVSGGAPLHRESRMYEPCPAVHLPSRSLSVAAASLRWPWRAATSTWPKFFFRDRTRSHLACFARCPPKAQSSRGRRSNSTFSFGKDTCTPPAFQLYQCSRDNLPHGVS
jgi:hypothetical protein